MIALIELYSVACRVIHWTSWNITKSCALNLLYQQLSSSHYMPCAPIWSLPTELACLCTQISATVVLSVELLGQGRMMNNLAKGKWNCSLTAAVDVHLQFARIRFKQQELQGTITVLFYHFLCPPYDVHYIPLFFKIPCAGLGLPLQTLILA